MNSKEIVTDNKKVVLSSVDDSRKVTIFSVGVDRSVMDFYEDDFCWLRVNIFEDCFKLSKAAFNNRRYSLLAEKYLMDGLEDMTCENIYSYLKCPRGMLSRYPNLKVESEFFFKNGIEYMPADFHSYILHHGNFIVKCNWIEDLPCRDINNLSHQELLTKIEHFVFLDENANWYKLAKVHDYDTDFYMYYDVLQRAYNRVSKDASEFIKTAHIFNFNEEAKKLICKMKMTGGKAIVVHVRENGDLMMDSISEKE